MNNKIITTFIANDQVSPTVGKISANVSSAGVAISKIASAILSLGSTASTAATNATPLRNILENIEKSSAIPLKYKESPHFCGLSKWWRWRESNPRLSVFQLKLLHA